MVMVSTDVQAEAIEIGSGGPYTIAFASGTSSRVYGGTIPFPSLTVRVGSGSTSEIDSQITSGSGVLTSDGDGTLYLANPANAYQSTVIQAGTVEISAMRLGAAPATPTTNIEFAGNATLETTALFAPEHQSRHPGRFRRCSHLRHGRLNLHDDWGRDRRGRRDCQGGGRKPGTGRNKHLSGEHAARPTAPRSAGASTPWAAARLIPASLLPWSPTPLSISTVRTKASPSAPSAPAGLRGRACKSATSPETARSPTTARAGAAASTSTWTTTGASPVPSPARSCSAHGQLPSVSIDVGGAILGGNYSQDSLTLDGPTLDLASFEEKSNSIPGTIQVGTAASGTQMFAHRLVDDPQSVYGLSSYFTWALTQTCTVSGDLLSGENAPPDPGRGRGVVRPRRLDQRLSGRRRRVADDHGKPRPDGQQYHRQRELACRPGLSDEGYYTLAEGSELELEYSSMTVSVVAQLLLDNSTLDAAGSAVVVDEGATLQLTSAQFQADSASTVGFGTIGTSGTAAMIGVDGQSDMDIAGPGYLDLGYCQFTLDGDSPRGGALSRRRANPPLVES